MRNPIPLATILVCVSFSLLIVSLFPEASLLLQPIFLLTAVLGLLLAVVIVVRHGRVAESGQVETDPLTGLANRRAFDAAVSAGSGPLVLLLIDLDDFRRINDTHGHLAGDRVLVTAAAALKRSGPPHGLSCRYGGEEFAIVLGGADLRQGVAAAEAVRTGFAAAQIAAADDSPLTASLGVALRQRGEGRESLIGRADLALYAAKRAGRDRTFFHDGESVQPAGSL